MTFEPHFIPNVACSNRVLTLGISPTLKVAAAVWIAEQTGAMAKTRLNCLQQAIGNLVGCRPTWGLWLVVGNRTAQPDNKITRYLGLWKSLQKRGGVLPVGNFLPESLVASEHGIRFFGAVGFKLEQIERVSDLMVSESALVVAAEEPSGQKLAQELALKGWSVPHAMPPEEVLELVCARNGVAVSVYGEFDDREVVAAIFGKEELVAQFAVK